MPMQGPAVLIWPSVKLKRRMQQRNFLSQKYTVDECYKIISCYICVCGWGEAGGEEGVGRGEGRGGGGVENGRRGVYVHMIHTYK